MGLSTTRPGHGTVGPPRTLPGVPMDDCWKLVLLRKLQSKRLETDGDNGSWQFFKMPNSWVRNGDLNEEKFRLLDQITSRGERCNPMKIYESTNPKLGEYLYIRRKDSYSIWKVPRPNNCTAPGLSSKSYSARREDSRKPKFRAELSRKVAALDPATIRKISATPPEIWERMIQLPLPAWDDLERFARRSSRLSPLSAERSEKHPATAIARPRRRRAQPRSDRRSVLNPSDCGDCPLPLPSRIPVPTGLREHSDGTYRYLTAPHLPRNGISHTATVDDIGPTDVILATRESKSSTTQTDEAVAASISPSSLALPFHRPKLIKPVSFRRADASKKDTQEDTARSKYLPAVAKKSDAGERADASKNDTHGDTHRATDLPVVYKKSGSGEKWWREDLALSPRLMKVEALEDSVVEYRKEEDGELIELGKGSVSTVYLADLIQYGKSRYVAVKEFDKELSTAYNIRKEAGVMQVLSGTGFVPHLFGFLSANLSLVQECFGQGTTLEDLLSAAHVFNLSQKIWLSIATHIAVALREFFKRGILHNDIKSENILVDWNTSDYPIKFIDMGRATYKTGFLYTERTARLAKWNQLAPELNLSTQTTPATEVYSLGSVLDSIATKGGLPEIQAIANSCVRPLPVNRPDIWSVVHSLEHLQRRMCK